MYIDLICHTLRVVMICSVFAYFVFVPLKSRLRYSMYQTGLLAALLILITTVITLLFLLPGFLLSRYSWIGILLWLSVALLLFHIAVKGSYYEILFIVLTVLNLYVNIAVIAKIIVEEIHCPIRSSMLYALTSGVVLLVYIPLLWSLSRLLRRVIELGITSSFWKVIWIIPALTYMIFYVKIINDYWRSPIRSAPYDIAFSILWSFTSYTFFWVTLQMLLQACTGIAATAQVKLITSQMSRQEGEYRRLLELREDGARKCHDWRHHLLSMYGLLEKGDPEKAKEYIRMLLPEYVTDAEGSLCCNHVVDVILKHYACMAKKHGIIMKSKVEIPEQVTVADTDLCIIFGNLMENAMEACLEQKDKKRLVEIKARMEGQQLVLTVQNTKASRSVVKNGIYYSTKHEGVGVGICSVKRVVDRYGGFLKINEEQEIFSVSILMNTKRRTE